MRNQFRIRHGQPELMGFGTVIPAGAIQVFPAPQDSSAIPSQRGGTSRNGVKYEAREGTRRYLPREAKTTDAVKEAGFILGLQTSDGTMYLQRHGTRYRLDRAVARGLVKPKNEAQAL